MRSPARGAAALLVATLALACGSGEEGPAISGRPVTLVAVERVDLTDRIEATGELQAEEDARIGAEVGGRVTEIIVDEGAAVEAGQAILAIDPERRRLERDAAGARLQEARAAFENQKSETARVEELHRRNVASETQIDEARTALSLARSRVDGAEAGFGVAERALRDATVRAPFAGIVSERFVGRGEYVTQGQALFHLVALDPITVEFHLSEVDSGRVHVGQQVEVRVDSHPGQVFRAQVSVVAPTIDTRTRTLRVKARLDNAEAMLRPGLFARVDLGVATRRGVRLIPEEAILRRADGAVVFRLGAENRVERLLVETGVQRGGVVEVVRGLEPGDMVVSRGHATLVDGEVVMPRHPDGSPLQSPVPDVASEPREGPG